MSATRKVDLDPAILPVIQSDVIMDTLPLRIFRNFTKVKTDLQRTPSDSIRFLKMNDLQGGGMLESEDTPIGHEKLGVNYVDVTVHEFGNGIKISRRALEQTPSPINLLTDAARLLMRNESMRMDEYYRDIFLGTANKIYYKTGGGGAATSDVNKKFDADVLKDAIEVLETNLVPKFRRGGDEFWACVAHPHVIRQLRDTTYWLEAHKYTDPQSIWNGEVGRIEDVVFFKKQDMPILTAGSANSLDVHRTVLLGSDAVASAITVPTELREGGVIDYNRWVAMVWYSIEGGGIIEDNMIEIQTEA